MTGRRILIPRLSVFIGLVLLGSELAGAQQSPVPPVRSLLPPFAGKSLAGEVMSVDPEKRTVVVRVLENGDRPYDIPIAVDERTVVKQLRTPISGGDLSPGHLVKVTYQDYDGRLVARRIEVRGKAVHQPMP